MKKIARKSVREVLNVRIRVRRSLLASLPRGGVTCMQSDSQVDARNRAGGKTRELDFEFSGAVHGPV